MILNYVHYDGSLLVCDFNLGQLINFSSSHWKNCMELINNNQQQLKQSTFNLDPGKRVRLQITQKLMK